MFRMSEKEKLEQIGEAVEVYSRLRGELSHITEKMTKTQQSYAFANQQFATLRVENGKLILQPSGNPNQPRDLEGLLNAHELVDLITERNRLNSELAEATARLRALAPHLL
jgi:hypothetical protein